MKYNILASFEYNGKTYVYYTESNNNKEVRYGYLDNNNIVEITDTKDIQMMNELSSKVFISSDIKNHIKLGITTYHGKLFQEMYDKKSDLKFFYEIKDGKYYTPSNEDAMNLFEMFNIHEMFLEYQNESKKEEEPKKEEETKGYKILRRILVYGMALVVALEVHSCIVRYNNDQQQTVQSYETSVTAEPRETAKIEYTEGDLIRAIDSNPNLTYGEKQIYKNHFEFVMKYADYTDFEYLIDKLKNAKITYTIEKNPEASASYYAPYDIYDYEATDFEHTQKSDTGHEVGHQCGGDHYGMGWGVYEATTEIENSEHEYAKDINSYYDIVAFQKIMYEIIGVDPFGQYQQDGDISNITKPLMEIINDENLANQLISALDKVVIYKKTFVDAKKEHTEEEREEARNNYVENNKQIIDMLSKYFYLAKGYPMEEDVISMMYLSLGYVKYDLAFRIGEFALSSDMTDSSYALKKGYYLKKYISKYSGYILIFNDPSGNEMRVTISDENRRIKPNGNVYNINTDSLGNELNIRSKTFDFEGHGLYEGAYEIDRCEDPIHYSNYGILNDRIEQTTYFKILYEILGSDSMIEFFNSKDLNVIMTELTSIISDQDMAKRLIKDIDEVSNYYNNSEDKTTNDSKSNIRNIREEINSLFCQYYQQKFGSPMHRDSLINFYYLELQGKIDNYGRLPYYIRVRSNRGDELLIGIGDNTAEVTVSKCYLDPNSIRDFPETNVFIASPKLERKMYMEINDGNRMMGKEIYNGTDLQLNFDEGKSKER